MACRGKISYPAADRNKQPILEVLRSILSQDKKYLALEIASGTGQHAVHFAKFLPNVLWQPTEITDALLVSIREYIKESKCTNIFDPFHLDVVELSQNIASCKKELYDVIVCINLFHIAPMKVSESFFMVVGQMLKQEGLLFTYGPYMVNGVITPESNVSFDAFLRTQDPLFGLRDINWISELALRNNIRLEQTIDMPANNKILIFSKLR